MNSIYVGQEVLIRFCDPNREQIMQETQKTLLINDSNYREPRSANFSKVYLEINQELKICFEKMKLI